MPKGKSSSDTIALKLLTNTMTLCNENLSAKKPPKGIEIMIKKLQKLRTVAAVKVDTLISISARKPKLRKTRYPAL